MRLVLFLFLLAGVHGQDFPFQIGETLEYIAEFNRVPVGHASLFVKGLETVNGHPTYHVRFKASTGWVGDQFYIIRDQVDIWLDQTKLYTHKVKKKIREGGYRKTSETVMDYDKMVAITAQDTVAIDFTVRDPYSMFYYLRTVPLPENKLMSFSTYENKKITNFKLIVTGQEIIRVPLGSFMCNVVKPFREKKTLLKNQGDMKIWFSDDKRRLPVKIQIKLKYGSLTLLLKNIKA